RSADQRKTANILQLGPGKTVQGREQYENFVIISQAVITLCGYGRIVVELDESALSRVIGRGLWQPVELGTDCEGQRREPIGAILVIGTDLSIRNILQRRSGVGHPSERLRIAREIGKVGAND